ncbi:thiamine-phosphate kinase [Chloroflexota bacterium]
MKVSELGEFGLIKMISNLISLPSKDKIILGIGDDATARKIDAGIELATIDTLVENVHFTLDTITYEELGWKSLAVNVSDIAAMGGVPLYALVSLGLPGNIDVNDIKKLYEGMLELANAYDITIAGGDVVKAPQLTISVSVTGKATDNKILKRSTAQPRDRIAVTGYLGTSAAGLKMLIDKLKFDDQTTSLLRKAHQQPQPRVAEGQTLVKSGVKAAIDLSDGLISDLGHICQMSNVGANIHVDKLPIHPIVRDNFEEKAIELAWCGGEDYELLFTAKPDIIDKVRQTTKTPITSIGYITSAHADKVILFDVKGNTINLEQEGWDHFSK